MNRNKTLKILRDKNTNYKEMKKLQSKGFIELYDVILEDNVPKKYGSKKVIPMDGVLGETTTLPFRLPTIQEANRYEQARKIIGKGGKRHRDAMTIESASRHKMDFFVTNNKKDFIDNNKREKLEKLFQNIKIITLDELKELLSVKRK